MSADKKLSAINEAKTSDLLLQRFGEKIDRQKQKALNRLTGQFRGGQYTQSDLVAGLAGYCALEDLQSELIKEIRNGRTAAKELYDAPSPESGTTSE